MDYKPGTFSSNNYYFNALTTRLFTLEVMLNLNGFLKDKYVQKIKISMFYIPIMNPKLYLTGSCGEPTNNSPVPSVGL